MQQIRGRYPEIFANCAASPSGFEHMPDRRGFHNLSPEERRAFWDELYATPGFAILAGNFTEVHMDPQANRELSEYIADRIRQRVKDPAVAEQLIPKDHGFGMQRLPLETRYFEAYNHDHVELVNITTSPIECVCAQGVQTAEKLYELDVLIYATGFDAITGAYDRIDIRGSNGAVLRDKTGLPTIPQIFVAGQHLGGATETFDAFNDNSLKAKLDECGVGYDPSMTRDAYSFLPTWLHPR